VISKTAAKRLKDAPWLQRADTQRVFELLEGRADKTRAVGGIVRDTLLDRVRDTAEIDFATVLLPDEVMRRAGEVGLAVYPTGIEHGTVTLKVGELVAEVTTLRQDVETDGRHAKVKFGTDWIRDAERRDFTLNALYAGMDGALFDPIEGVEDCLAGRVAFIGDADRRISEDRLRVYRFFRFTASHGREEFDDTGLAAVARAASDLGALSAERVGGEIRRLLDLGRVARTFTAMSSAGVLVLPATLLDQLGGYERRARKPNAGPRLSLVVAALGDAQVKRMWRLSNDEVDGAVAMLAAARLLIDFHLNEAAYRFPAVLADAVELAATLAGWTEAGKSAVVQGLEVIEVPKFPLSGDDLIARGIAAGPALGAELDRLEKKWIASGFKLGRDALLGEAKR
jgi:poly(A) polymerase